ncbi:MAG: hypothetical protein COB67_00430 [SAR324 cluster bacterium]|uniref:Uncharacterized protein n=1 Tax=SAR324 cluster bacterium TaxID=2024889 RepID=A0A2A4TCV2_9DELT|nr:MAG: hypothetical protein COB67_00430 [SAR324 cluster bacterium]
MKTYGKKLLEYLLIKRYLNNQYKTEIFNKYRFIFIEDKNTLKLSMDLFDQDKKWVEEPINPTCGQARKLAAKECTCRFASNVKYSEEIIKEIMKEIAKFMEVDFLLLELDDENDGIYLIILENQVVSISLTFPNRSDEEHKHIALVDFLDNTNIALNNAIVEKFDNICNMTEQLNVLSAQYMEKI